MQKTLAMFPVVLSATVSTAAIVSRSGGVLFEETGLRIAPQALAAGWRAVEIAGDGSPAEDRGCSFKGGGKDDVAFTGQAKYWRMGEGAYAASIEMVVTAERTYAAFGVSIAMPYDDYAGGRFKTDTLNRGIPGLQDKPKAWLGGGETRIASFQRADGGGRIAFTFAEPVRFSVQDARKSGGGLLLRLGEGSAGKPLPIGHVFKTDFTFTIPEEAQIVYDDIVSIAAGPEWIPISGRNDIVAGSALDFSTPEMGFADAHRPAGIHGRVVARGGHFEFAGRPGIPVRFYGANLCSGANFLQPEEAEKLAERFARMGCNAVRLHHHDAGLVAGDPAGTTIMPEPLDQFDRLVAAFIARGIYVSTDLFVSRSVANRAVGIDAEGRLNYNHYKVRVLVDDAVFADLASFSRQFLAHVNPYTGRSYAREPALAWLSLVNEGNVGNYYDIVRTDPVWAARWRDWVLKGRADDPARYGDVSEALPKTLRADDAPGTEFKRFVADLERRFFLRMRALVRDELGCEALLSNWNGWTYFATDQITRAEYDYVDDHAYVDHPVFLGKSWSPPVKFQNGNVNPIRTDGSGMPWVAGNRLLDRPFTLSEHNFGAPMRHRAAFGLVSGTAAALQDWGGIWRFAYAHNREDAVSDVPAPIRFFDLSRDPAHRLADRAAVCLFRRGDLAPIPPERTLAIEIDPQAVASARTNIPGAAWGNVWAAWQARVGCVLAGGPEAPSSMLHYPDAYRLSAAELGPASGGLIVGGGVPERYAPPDGRFAVSRHDGSFAVDTARTAGAYLERGSHRGSVLSFELEGGEAAVWVSSLDGQPLRRSTRMLLVHLPDIQNSGAEYDGVARGVLTAYGQAPHLARNSRARVRLLLDDPARCVVYRLALDGSRVAEVPSVVEGGALVFDASVALDPASATLLYEISVNSPRKQLEKRTQNP